MRACMCEFGFTYAWTGVSQKSFRWSSLIYGGTSAWTRLSPVSIIYTVESVHLRFVIFTNNVMTHCILPKFALFFPFKRPCYINTTSSLQLHTFWQCKTSISAIFSRPNVKFSETQHQTQLHWTVWDIYNVPIELHLIRTGQPIVYRPHGSVQLCLMPNRRCTLSTVYI